MDSITVYAQDEERGEYWRLSLSLRQYRKHDNGAMISCGLSVPKDISRNALRYCSPVAVTKEQWNHSGCQSSCVLRGAATCRW